MRRWWLAGPLVVALAATGIALATHAGGRTHDHHIVTKPALVGRISLDPAAPKPGQPVIATLSIRADRRITLTGLVLAVRDARGSSTDGAGRAYDFPDAGAVRLDAKPHTLAVAHEFPTRGTYSYFLRYRVGTSWRTLPPYNTFTVG